MVWLTIKQWYVLYGKRCYICINEEDFQDIENKAIWLWQTKGWKVKGEHFQSQSKRHQKKWYRLKTFDGNVTFNDAVLTLKIYTSKKWRARGICIKICFWLVIKGEINWKYIIQCYGMCIFKSRVYEVGWRWQSICLHQ